MRASTLTRPPAVAGRFYPGSAPELAATVAGLLAAAPACASRPKGVIAPHAGYVYSGPIAATAYAALAGRADEIRKVVILGPAHRVHLRGLAVPSAARFATPLGELEIDQPLRDAILDLPFVVASDEAHALEHSLEVHLPFLQRLIPSFTILPVVVGDARPDQVAAVLARCWGGPETAIVISTDLSHYHEYAEATALDAATAAWMSSSRVPGLDPRRACGARCIDGLLARGEHHPLRLELLDLRNSGDTAGSRDQVVGYAAFAIHETRPQETAP